MTQSKDPIESIEQLHLMRAALLEWFGHQKRDLPWRNTDDPYAIWLSEIMLQQTRVETVIPYYHRFLERFPNVHALANADLSEVLALWSGLGYYRRARNLHAASQRISEDFEGEIPSDFPQITSLPGIGRYTAGAILSIAYDKEYAVVDGNVHRVFARLFCLDAPRSSPALDRQCWQVAQELIKGARPGDLNQALMELGALLCTPRNPACMLCPIRSECQAHAEGTQANFPRPRVKKEVQTLHVLWAMLQRSGKILLFKRPEDGLFAGLWELPGIYLSPSESPQIETIQHFLEEAGLCVQFGKEVQNYSHTLSHRQLQIQVFRATRIHGRILLPRQRWRWFFPEELSTLGLSSITKKVLQTHIPN